MSENTLRCIRAGCGGLLDWNTGNGKCLKCGTELRVRKERRDIKNQTNWASLRIRRDPRTNEVYYDVLLGVIGKEPHAHWGFNIGQSLKFIEGRGKIHGMARKVDSRKYGFLEEKHAIIDEKASPDITLSLKITLTDLELSIIEASIAEFAFK